MRGKEEGCKWVAGARYKGRPSAWAMNHGAPMGDYVILLAREVAVVCSWEIGSCATALCGMPLQTLLIWVIWVRRAALIGPSSLRGR